MPLLFAMCPRTDTSTSHYAPVVNFRQEISPIPQYLSDCPPTGGRQRGLIRPRDPGGPNLFVVVNQTASEQALYAYLKLSWDEMSKRVDLGMSEKNKSSQSYTHHFLSLSPSLPPSLSLLPLLSPSLPPFLYSLWFLWSGPFQSNFQLIKAEYMDL